MTTDIKIRLVLDRAGYSSAVNAAGAEATRMGSTITSAAGRSSSALDGIRGSVRGVSVALGDLARGAVVINGITAGVERLGSAVAALPTRGLSFLAETEVAQLGMAGILQSMVEIEGKAPSFAQAQDMAAGAVSRLQKAAAETSASSEDLIATYRALLGPALAAGMSMQQLETFTVVGANAVKSMGMTTGQMVQELRDLAQGGITAAGSTLATALGLKDADIAKAKTSSEGLFAFLMNRMEGFASTSQAYSTTLKGSAEALQEQITQASAQAMAPAAAAAKDLVAQISEAFKGDGIKSGLDSMGQGIASTISGIGSGIGIVQQYSGAISGLVGVLAVAKFSAMAGEVAQLTSAKMQASGASRLAAAQAAIEADANNAVTLSSRQQLAALLAEQRAKVAALAQEQALTAAKLRSAEATAAQLVGQARLNALEQQVLPLRQQHAQQTAALDQAQQRLASATTASSAAMRGMGVVMGALGGPVGILITGLAAVVGYMMSANSEAQKLGNIKLSTGRAEEALAKGGKVDQTDASRVQAALNEAKEKRDTLLVESRKPASMADRSKGLFGGDSTVEKRAKDLAAAEADVKRLEALSARIEGAQNAVASAAPGAVNLRSGVSSKALDEMLADVKTIDGIKAAGAERLKTLATLSAKERELMVTRGATAKQLAEFDAKVAGARAGIERDTTTDLQGLRTKQGKAAKGEFGGADNAEARAAAIEKASADLRLAQLKQSSAARTVELERELQAAEALHQQGLTGVADYESERVRIQAAKLTERLALIDAEIAAENARAPKDRAEVLRRDQRVVELGTDRAGVVADISATQAAGASGAAARDLERQRAIATENAQVWQTAQQQIEQLRLSTAASAAALLTDPVAKLRAETAAQVAALQKSADDLTRELTVRLSVTTDPGQREMLQAQITSIADTTSSAIVQANSTLTDKLKPGWQTMVEGWADTNRLMREASDQTMGNLLKGGEDAFVGLLQTGKLNVKGLADSMIAEMARVEFRKLVGGTDAGRSGVSMLAGLLGAKGAQPKGAAADAAAFVGPQEEGFKRVTEQVNGLGPVLAKFGEGLTGGASKLGDFVSGLGSSLSGLFSGGGGAAGAGAGGGGGWGGVISLVTSLFAADGAAFGAGGVRRFAAGGSFTNSIVSRDTNFRFRDAGGREQLGLMGEAGPEAIMPLSGGGAQAIGPDGRRLGNLPVTRGTDGRLSVVLDDALTSRRGQRFAAGGAFGGPAMPAPSMSPAGGPAPAISAPLTVSISDLSQVQTMINQALTAQRRALSAALKDKLGVTI